jgi:SAM-dependent methyltransferase
MSRREYVRMADQTAGAMPGRRVLDWGCGYGQMSYLLARRGFEVTSYDVGRALEDGRMAAALGLRAVRGDDASRLPFRTGAFDGVLACGVLEHVADADGALDELRRVLVASGRLFVYNLPQRSSYKELAIEHLHLGYAHDRRYTEASITALLGRHRFRVVQVARAGLLPHLGTGLPRVVRRAYDAAAPALYPLDRFLCDIPLVNLVAESLEFVAEREARVSAEAGAGRA